MAENERPLVSAKWLLTRINTPDLRIIDASWHMPATGRNGYREYLQQHIPGAVYFDIDKHCAVSELPHMLPSPDQFAKAVGELGINEKNTIVVYDALGLMSAARVWWMFRFFGARNVFVLDGGLPAYINADGPLEAAEAKLLPCEFEAGTAQGRAVTAEEVLAAIKNRSTRILDARSPGRFAGTEPEPREGLRSGHIPGSTSLPFTELLDDGRLKSNEELLDVFASYEVNKDSSVITTCGSGVTAAIISLALFCIGMRETALFDGSWSEWGSRDDLPVQTR